MQRFHPLSFILGLGSGILILFVVVTGMRLFHPATTTAIAPGANARGQFANGAGNIARMAERFGMTETELQKEIDSGKTMQEIAQEHGVTFGGGQGRRSGSGAVRGFGSGRILSSAASSSQAK